MEYITQPAPIATTVGRNLLAGGQVVSERIISLEELASQGRYEAAPEERAYTIAAPAPVMYEAVEYVSPNIEYVSAAPTIEYLTAAPTMEYVTGAPMVEYLTSEPLVEYVQPGMGQYVGGQFY